MFFTIRPSGGGANNPLHITPAPSVTTYVYDCRNGFQYTVLPTYTLLDVQLSAKTGCPLALMTSNDRSLFSPGSVFELATCEAINSILGDPLFTVNIGVVTEAKYDSNGVDIVFTNNRGPQNFLN